MSISQCPINLGPIDHLPLAISSSNVLFSYFSQLRFESIKWLRTTTNAQSANCIVAPRWLSQTDIFPCLSYNRVCPATTLGLRSRRGRWLWLQMGNGWLNPAPSALWGRECDVYTLRSGLVCGSECGAVMVNLPICNWGECVVRIERKWESNDPIIFGFTWLGEGGGNVSALILIRASHGVLFSRKSIVV